MSVIGNPIMTGGGNGAYASIRVSGDIANTNTCYATLGSITKQGRWSTVPNPEYRNLPSGYTQVDYIASSGSQKIDTGVECSADLKFDITFINRQTSGEWEILGSGQFSPLINSACFRPVDLVKQVNYTWQVGQKYHLVGDTNSVTINDVYYPFISSYGNYWSGNVSLFVSTHYGDYSTAELYQTKIYKNGVLTRDFVPCKQNSNDEYGLYDLANDVFYSNVGTGSFTGGNATPTTVSYWYIGNIKDYGTWTVHWSNGTKTHTRNVLIDVVTEYSVEDIDRLYLYNEGDECTELTGGWTTRGAKFYTPSVAPTKTISGSNMVVSLAGSNSQKSGVCEIANDVGVTNYDKLCISLIGYVSTYCVESLVIGNRNSIAVSYEQEGGDYHIGLNVSTGVLTIQIDNLTGNKDIAILLAPYNGTANNSVTFDKLWLE